MASETASTPADTVRDGLKTGFGFGVAIALVHLAQGIGLLVALGQPPLTGMAIQSFVMELLLALPLALLLSPLRRLPRGEWLMPVGMALGWIAMERWVAVDPSRIPMWLAPSLAAVIVFAIGRALWARSQKATVGVVLGLFVVLLIIPVARYSMTVQDKAMPTQATPPEGAPDVLFIVMDTVRAMNTSAYGYERETTPNLDRLAAEGVIFEDAYAPATWSLPAHAAIFTGMYPSKNNAHAETRYLPEGGGTLPTLAEHLALAGWDTYAFSANPHISDAFGLTRGFMYNDKAWQSGQSARSFSFIYRIVDVLGLASDPDKGGAQVVQNITEWMEGRDPNGRPALVFVNFLEAHFPFHQMPDEYLYAYQNRDIAELREIGQVSFGVQFGRQLSEAELERIRQPIVDMYDGGVLYTDHLVGEVVDLWRKRGLLDNTVVIVLGDHGEVLGEHGAFGHVTPVVEEDLRVPFVIRYPARIPAGSRVKQGVTTVGLFDTVTDLLGIPGSPVVQVLSLLPGIDNVIVGKPLLAERFEEEMLASRFAPGTANGTGPEVNPHGRFRVFRHGDYKLVQHDVDGSFLFNLAEDPGELRDLAQAEPEVLDDMSKRLERWRIELNLPTLDAEVDLSAGGEMDLDTCLSLQALGYIDDCSEYE
ncbi:MAG: sulfatase [Alphaproteobacteria bacterium]|nr:sulfatase [Alphaproteobacteria bacterium]